MLTFPLGLKVIIKEVNNTYYSSEVLNAGV
jgi:hypothetical protein